MKFTESPQELFDTSVLATYRQGEPSRNMGQAIGPVCPYRGPRGLKCAIGQLIDDEDYRPQIEMPARPEL